MNSGKIDNQLNLAMDISNAVREETVDLDTGYNRDFQTWELIVRYIGDLQALSEKYEFGYVILLNQYAIITGFPLAASIKSSSASIFLS